MSRVVITALLMSTLYGPILAQYKEEYVRQYMDIAVSEMHRTGIPASIKLAQAILESNYGRSELARESHNHFGIKCGRDWADKGYHLKDDDHDEKGELVNSCFRMYKSAEESYVAHSEFLTDPGKAHRYGTLFKLAPDDYKGWADGLKRGGYATNPEYARLLVRIIEEQKLYQYDVRKIDSDLASGRRKNTHRKHDDANQPNIHESLGGKNIYTIQFQNDIPYIIAAHGDNVKRVSTQTEVPPHRIIRYNEFVTNRRTQLDDGDRIYLQPLKRKFHGNNSSHIVEPGESVQTIAHFYGIKSDVLRKRNNIPDGCEPAPGSRLVLKGKQRNQIKCTSEQSIFASSPNSSVPRENQSEPTSPAIEVVLVEPKTESELIVAQSQQPKSQSLKASAPAAPDFSMQEILSYTVQPKDTLYQIATRHGISVVELKKMNNLSTDTIHPGQALKIQK